MRDTSAPIGLIMREKSSRAQLFSPFLGGSTFRDEGGAMSSVWVKNLPFIRQPNTFAPR
jgi:hypothetical protein